MATITADHAKADFDALLRRAAAGEEIVITENGTPVARMIPAERAADPSETRSRGAMTLEELREFRKRITLGPGLTIKQLIEEGRR